MVNPKAREQRHSLWKQLTIRRKFEESNRRMWFHSTGLWVERKKKRKYVAQVIRRREGEKYIQRRYLDILRGSSLKTKWHLKGRKDEKTNAEKNASATILRRYRVYVIIALAKMKHACLWSSYKWTTSLLQFLLVLFCFEKVTVFVGFFQVNTIKIHLAKIVEGSVWS